MQQVWNWLKLMATGRRVVIVFIAAMAFNAWFFTAGPYAQMAEHGGIIDERFGSSANEIARDAETYNATAAHDYRTFLGFDVLFPVLQSAWLLGFLAIGTVRWKRLPDAVMAFPIAAILFDWIENLAILNLLRAEPWTGMAALAFAAMHLKLVASAAGFIVAIVLLGWYVSNPVQPKRGIKRR